MDDCHTPLPLSRGDDASADARSHPESGSDSGEHSDDDVENFPQMLLFSIVDLVDS